MSEIVKAAQEAIDTKELQEIAKTLAQYNLGICVPHTHHAQTGEILPLPAGMIVNESDLMITFVTAAENEIAQTAPVGWRWNGKTMEVCASCCSTGYPAPNKK